MTKLSDDDKLIVDNYFSNALLEIQEGLPIDVLREVLEYYEENENYLACAGVNKAIKWYKMHTFTKVMVKVNEINNDDDLSELKYE